MDNFAQQGRDLEAQAVKKLKGSVFGNILSSKSDRADQALQLFEKAANCFKLSKNYEKSAEMYIKCAECEEICGQDPAQHYQDAANQMKNVSTAEYIKYAQIAINSYCNSGRISSAAQMQKALAEQLEQDYEYEAAIESFGKASDLYGMENQTTNQQQCSLKTADLIIISGADEFGRCIQVSWQYQSSQTYEKVAMKYLTVPLLKPNAKGLFLKCGICHLANDDLIGAKKSIEHYSNEDPSFDGSREQKLVSAIVDTIESQDEQGNQKVLQDF